MLKLVKPEEPKWTNREAWVYIFDLIRRSSSLPKEEREKLIDSLDEILLLSRK